jgi:hypothetical protein
MGGLGGARSLGANEAARAALPVPAAEPSAPTFDDSNAWHARAAKGMRFGLLLGLALTSLQAASAHATTISIYTGYTDADFSAFSLPPDSAEITFTSPLSLHQSLSAVTPTAYSFTDYIFAFASFNSTSSFSEFRTGPTGVSPPMDIFSRADDGTTDNYLEPPVADLNELSGRSGACPIDCTVFSLVEETYDPGHWVYDRGPVHPSPVFLTLFVTVGLLGLFWRRGKGRRGSPPAS